MMKEYISEEEHIKYTAELRKRSRFNRFTLLAFLFIGPLAVFLEPPYQSFAFIASVLLFVLAGLSHIKSQYFRVCPRCNGRLNSLTNVCIKCGANVHRVGKRSDGSEWLN